MVKFITRCSRSLTLLFCVVMLLFMGVLYWVHSGERSLEWAKPWIMHQLNSSDSPYRLNFSAVTVEWANLAELGHLRMKDVAVSRSDGAVFATLPKLEVTIDPIGFMPGRSFLRGVWLSSPKIYLTRDDKGVIQLGLEGASGTTPLRDLFANTSGAKADTSGKPLTMPFRKFYVTNASLDFSDVNSGTSLVSKSFGMAMVHGREGYNAKLVFPFEYEEAAARLDARLRPQDKNTMQLDITLTRAPAKLLCVFGLCPDDVEGDGPVNGTVGLTMTPAGDPLAVQVALRTNRATLTAPKLFDKPLKLGPSTLTASSTAESHTIRMSGLNLTLEDTTINGTGAFHHDEAGWTVALDAKMGALDVTKIKHYWPLPLAPDSREWVTSKMKSGTAPASSLQVRLNPEDFAAAAFPDESVAADVEAKGVTFEYLPGFPEVKTMDAKVHFTGRTIKIEGGGGSLLTGTKVNKATLWMPDLLNPRNPMEAKLDLSAPAGDIATFLALKHFPFDDAATLNPETIKGSATANVNLKFNSFSEKKTAANEVNFDHVEYDIAADLQNIAQEKFAGGYSLKNLSGQLKAKNGSVGFSGNATVGDAPSMSVDVAQATGKPTTLKVKTSATEKSAGPSNDFELRYEARGDVPALSIKGRELDATASYSNSENGILKNFPALQLDMALDRLWLSKDAPLNDVNATLSCNSLRCESANFSMLAGRGQVRGGIAQVKGHRQFSLVADNAGEFLTALDITDRMKGGKLDFLGPYDDTKSPPALAAKLAIHDFKLINAQILGRILTVTSLTGVQNLLTGSGISFDKLTAEIRSQNGVVGVSKGRASGASIGITIEGELDTTSTKIAMKGVVVPAYALNSILNNIPIIGNLLGGEGEGLVAFNYFVSGTYAKPDVSVNPLSGLTPGFLRGIFGVFDSKSDTRVDIDKGDKNDKHEQPDKKSAGAPTVKNR